MKITTEQAEEICYVQGPRRRNSDREAAPIRLYYPVFQTHIE